MALSDFAARQAKATDKDYTGHGICGTISTALNEIGYPEIRDVFGT